jgi:adenylate kinase
MISKNSNFIIIGPSGSGKGTQAEFVSQNFGGQRHLVTGELLREIASQETELGKKIKKTINYGKWVEDKVVNQVIRETLEKTDKNQGLILDGYPRAVEQAKYLDELLKKLDRFQPIVINLIVSPKSVVYRLLNRKICDKCGQLYHPPESLSETDCKKCGGKLTRREKVI